MFVIYTAISVKLKYLSALFVILLQLGSLGEIHAASLNNFVPLQTNFESNRDKRGDLGGPYPMHTVDIIEQHGYPVETHFVETQDGYILEVHRIPPLAKNDKLPVLLTHGNFQSSAEWVINTPTNNSFAFILHSMGYDVWLGNNRGNPYGRRHKSFATNSPSFWNYTFHEMGLFDMPATIDHVLNQTGKSKLNYVSLSMGPAAFLAGLSHHPEYNGKIESAVLMGPTVFMAHFYNGLVYYMSFLSRFITMFLNAFGSIPAISPTLGKLLNGLLPYLCSPKVDIIGICVNWIHIVYGQDGDLITKEQVAQVFATTPASGSSLKLTNHVMQLWRSKGFQEYDYGRRKNLEIYHSETPPSYNLTKATVPIALFVGLYDFMGHREDAKTLASKLPTLIEYYESPYKQFCHLDFVYGREIAAQLYYHAIEIFQIKEK
ncbi:lipase 3 isoform X1 [Folsomia candida]|uniref:lipase 3 isoform X1 n=2 Tax=Folsomia candida TaxID=158441 RepID=UPI001604CEC2|nr:lipase 3 isoform X1 [Folsomia candida]